MILILLDLLLILHSVAAEFVEDTAVDPEAVAAVEAAAVDNNMQQPVEEPSNVRLGFAEMLPKDCSVDVNAIDLTKGQAQILLPSKDRQTQTMYENEVERITRFAAEVLDPSNVSDESVKRELEETGFDKREAIGHTINESLHEFKSEENVIIFSTLLLKKDSKSYPWDDMSKALSISADKIQRHYYSCNKRNINIFASIQPDIAKALSLVLKTVLEDYPQLNKYKAQIMFKLSNSLFWDEKETEEVLDNDDRKQPAQSEEVVGDDATSGAGGNPTPPALPPLLLQSGSDKKRRVIDEDSNDGVVEAAKKRRASNSNIGIVEI